MSTVVTVTTGDRGVKVFAVTPRPGQAPQPQDFSDFGDVPPHSEIQFSSFDGRDILVCEQAEAIDDEAFPAEFSGYAEAESEAA